MSAAGTPTPSQPQPTVHPRLRTLLLLLFGTTFCWYIIPGVYFAYGVFGAAVAIAITCVLALVLRGEADPVVLIWVAIFPLGYYFLSFPRERAIVSFDRAVVLLLCVAACCASPAKIMRLPRPMCRAGWSWLLFVFAVLLSFVHLSNLLSPLRVLVDAYILPALLGWCVIRCFPVLRRLLALHILLCIMAAYLAAIGAAEMVLNVHLLPLAGAGAYYAGLGDSLLLRPNGPFLASHSFSLIGLFCFWFLAFLRRAAGAELPRWQKWLHWCGVTSAVIVAFLPLFRSIMLTFLGLAILDAFWERRTSRYLLAVVSLAILSGLVFAAWLLSPEILVERFLDPANLFARIAQQQQTLRVFQQSPLTGVGFTNYMTGVEQPGSSGASFQDVSALDSPHNNLGAVLSETGLCGFLTFLFAQGFFLRAFWRARAAQTKRALLAWQFFCYAFLSYWISGLDISTMYSSDLNLFYLFMTAVLYKYGTGAAESPAA